MKKIYQYRYYNEADTSRNYPKGIAFRNLVSGSVFAKTLPIVQLGIQALPGTKFYLNNNNHPIIIGNTGIYELDLNGQTEITALSFDSVSVRAIDANQNGYLIVDVIYESEA